MALIGAVSSNYGADAQYHIIKSYSWNKLETISIFVASYIDAAAKESGCEPVLYRSFSISNDPQIDNISLEFLYDKLKLISDFAGFTSDNV